MSDPTREAPPEPSADHFPNPRPGWATSRRSAANAPEPTRPSDLAGPPGSYQGAFGPLVAPAAPPPPTRDTLPGVHGNLESFLYICGGVIVIAALAFGAVYIIRGRSAGSPATVAGASSTANLIGDSTPLGAAMGTIIFSDDFTNPGSGWPTADLANQYTTAQYQAGGYVIGSIGSSDEAAVGQSVENLVFPAKPATTQQLSMSLTATQTDAVAGAGIGVSCRRGTGNAQVTYSFIVYNTGEYAIERLFGPASTEQRATLMWQGNAGMGPGSTPLTIVGICATMADGERVRLALFVEGRLLSDTIDVVASSTESWRGGIDMVGGATDSIMTAKYWEERDLAR